MDPVATELFDLLGVPNVPALVPLLVVIVQWKRKKRPTMNTSGPSALRNTFASLADYQGKPMTMVVCRILQHYPMSICNRIAFAWRTSWWCGDVSVILPLLFRYTLQINPSTARSGREKAADPWTCRRTRGSSPTACTWVIWKHLFVLVSVVLGLQCWQVFRIYTSMEYFELGGLRSLSTVQHLPRVARAASERPTTAPSLELRMLCVALRL